jgi:hypothetical protein
VLTALLLAACGLPGSSQDPSAATVLAAAQAVNIQDLSFTGTAALTLDLGALTGSSGGGATNFTFNGNITGEITSSPQRADLTLTASQTELAKITTDAATKTGYVNVPALSGLSGSAGNSCFQLPLDSVSSVLDTSIFSKFEKISNAKNIGSDSIGGVAVWHLQGNQTYGGATVTEDFYVRKDNSYPVRVVITGSASAPSSGGSSGPSGSITFTIDITHVNSGITISLPASCTTIGG